MKRIVVLGAGESGAGAAVLAKQQGFDVFVSDLSEIKENYKELLNQYQIEWEEKQHTEALILNADEVIKSPGIPDKAPIIKNLKEKNIPIISEIEFAGRFTNAKMICITGSNGKTTTTMLTYHILKNAGYNVGLAGNVGQSLAYQVATSSRDYYVVEISSFQLDGMYDFKADVAILLNITPDHLDRYEYNFQNYVDSKFRIIRNQTSEDAFIFWDDDPVIQSEITKRSILAAKYPFSLKKKEHCKAYIENNNLIIETSNNPLIMPVKELSLKGIHNTYNMMAAGLAASAVNVKKEFIRQSLQDFQGVEHRLEYVATVKNVTFINDSKATNVNSCWYALESMKTPVILILGGTDKGNDYSEIESLVKEKVKALVFLGVDNTPLHRFFDGKIDKIVDVRSMEDAVKAAYAMAEEGDTVLLSPCCASFDLFQNYEDRGRQFKTCVRNL
ncbi:MAG TPA: UDP-N-acetylmuramoyl-L-alanine--D-glutamate ligase [Paludibacteraceae bacterium]|nr:UDP-N-acetylmuramoyl-L-alanine--D-glutamate ligase [Paludibacteraceae bacterium]MBP8965978.1 UDP-N-acetylmuramoyl-L-alanine--D-glutamate ligase [Paludibacteraceae bacterium]HOF97943.1 UDP-N-acetylmuramoyl-L-alanine--D-glutamate ligase [Paludibacteraceae bacterium]HOR38584.1 UDP-N-acetylmuramoyl-L-alanine--D-glutamate ligase [Paludibacteraceae bacterium]HPD58405.1 UDP-N-acetylmuramoyl-L-alanine--D-glutamate ligase [Paludibacteraceae bacterium]